MINNAELVFAKTSCDKLKLIFEALIKESNAKIGP
jgi:hypothetical protein